MNVCIPCRDIDPQTNGEGVCRKCSAKTKIIHKWSPPKKTNDRAWKLIEKGDWLWDKKRVLRISTRKKGQYPYNVDKDYYFNLLRRNKKQQQFKSKP